MASPREHMVYGTLITDFFGRDRLRRFFWLNALGMAFTDRKDKIKGHCDEVAQNLAQQRRDRSAPTHLGYCHSEVTIIRLKVSSWFHITLTLAALVLRQALLVNSIIPPSTRLARSPHPGPRWPEPGARVREEGTSAHTTIYQTRLNTPGIFARLGQ